MSGVRGKSGRCMVDHAGKQYGLWTVLEHVPSESTTMWMAKCDCGTVARVRISALVAGKSTQCTRHKTICVACGVEFLAGHKGMTLCAQCVYKAIYAKRKSVKQYELICVQCGKHFNGYEKRIKTCSPECASARIRANSMATNVKRRTYTELVCQECGKTFRFQPSQKNAGKFCSRKCHHATLAREGKPEKRKERKCKQCGVVLQWGHVGQYCSKICKYEAYQYNMVECTCSVCGKTYVGAKHSKRCGADRCQKDYQNEKEGRRKAMKRANAVGKVDLLYIRIRDGNRCGICNKMIQFSKPWPHPLSPSYDHIIPLSKGGEHSNRNLRLTHLRCNMAKKAKVGDGVQMNLF